MRKFVIIALAAIALAACQTQPIYQPDHAVPPQAQSLPLERIEALIVEAGQTRRWTFVHVGPGHLVATQQEPKYSADVDIFFSRDSYRLAYKSSNGLEEKDGVIHQHYNMWVRYLESDINLRLSNAPLIK
ncbi:MAG TPA: hypothetical protein VK558_02155 [Patescibacteria group bacterium]|nr:hypothetical protein [Patescibacteria group bacterium]